MSRRGFTLLEVMMSVALLAIVMGMLYTLADAMRVSADTQEAKMTAQDESRNAMMRITKELRQAALSSLVYNGAPSTTIQYRVPQDTDGNGNPVDPDGFVELGPLRTIERDTTDLNNDGQTTTQLILTDGTNVTVLCNNLAPDEDANNNNTLDAGEDSNGNGTLERGIVFQAAGNQVQVTVQTLRRPSVTARPLISTITQTILPRN